MSIFLKKIPVFVATCFGAGSVLPFGQGTLGAFLGILLVPIFLTHSLLSQIVMVLAVSVLGIWSSGIAERTFGRNDDHRIVIDEFVSIFITFLGMSAGLGWGVLVAGFLLNRALDIWKPFFINRLQDLPGGWGIMLDDVASALLSRVILAMMMFLMMLLL